MQMQNPPVEVTEAQALSLIADKWTSRGLGAEASMDRLQRLRENGRELQTR